jgi:hypothetical protein
MLSKGILALIYFSTITIVAKVSSYLSLVLLKELRVKELLHTIMLLMSKLVLIS